ncbi:hypothetical protein JG688_00011445 [Phytophthora aleatoria]|uniref:Uncharacterized protein n=1 Tax=Phytophthora aleatoria TaxID=2496075 RepID=A0A8J5IGT6_9STRA|nr:hypothetical protein JG688_00011445 [Phytophthora aleatoria]
MDTSGMATASERSAADTTWLLPHTLFGDPTSNGRYAPLLPSSSVCDFHKWRMLWQLVMMDYERVVLIGWAGLLRGYPTRRHSEEWAQWQPSVSNQARFVPSRFDTRSTRSC